MRSPRPGRLRITVAPVSQVGALLASYRRRPEDGEALHPRLLERSARGGIWWSLDPDWRGWRPSPRGRTGRGHGGAGP